VCCVLTSLPLFQLTVLTDLCFGIRVDAINAPNYEAPINFAMESAQIFLTKYKLVPVYKNLLYSIPSSISLILSPSIATLMNLEKV
jgi:hypothetical protein